MTFGDRAVSKVFTIDDNEDPKMKEEILTAGIFGRLIDIFTADIEPVSKSMKFGKFEAKGEIWTIIQLTEIAPKVPNCLLIVIEAFDPLSAKQFDQITLKITLKHM